MPKYKKISERNVYIEIVNKISQHICGRIKVSGMRVKEINYNEEKINEVLDKQHFTRIVEYDIEMPVFSLALQNIQLEPVAKRAPYKKQEPVINKSRTRYCHSEKQADILRKLNLEYLIK